MSNGSTSLRTLVTCHRGRCWFYSMDGVDRFYISTDYLALADKSAGQMLLYPTPPTRPAQANRPFVRRYELRTSNYIQVQTLTNESTEILVTEHWMREMRAAFEAARQILAVTPLRSFTAEVDAHDTLIIRDADLRTLPPSAH